MPSVLSIAEETGVSFGLCSTGTGKEARDCGRSSTGLDFLHAGAVRSLVDSLRFSTMVTRRVNG